MPTEQERRQARERAAEIRRKAGGKVAWDRLRAARPGTGGFVPAAPGESVEAMAALAEEHGVGLDPFEDLYPADNCGHRFDDDYPPRVILCMMAHEEAQPWAVATPIPSPGAYCMIIDGPVPGAVRDALAEAVAACGRDKSRGLLPDRLRDVFPELESEPYLRYGSLPGDATYMCRTPGGTLFVDVDGNRDDALHSHAWQVPMRRPTRMYVVFAPDGTLAEAHCVAMFAGFASNVMRDDARDTKFIPGADAAELLRTSRRMDRVQRKAEEYAMDVFYDIYGRIAGERCQPDMPQETLLRRLVNEYRDEKHAEMRYKAAVAYRDAEYAERRRRAEELAEAGTPGSRPTEPEKPRRTLAEMVYQGLA